MTRTYTAVINPTAGGRPAAACLAVARILRDAGATVTVEHSRSIDHTRQLAAEAAAREDVVIAVGGDGMVGCLGAAVVASGGVLGILPAGRGNDFARQLGVAGEPAALARILLDGRERAVDVIAVGERIVLGSVYTGIDAVANVVANRSRWVPKRLVYDVAGVRALLGWKPASYRVTVEDAQHEFLGHTVVAANSGYYGSGQHIAPDAEVDDGLLDVVLFGNVPKLRCLLASLRDIPAGTHVDLPQVHVLRGRELTIEADRPLPVYGDGEPVTTLPVTLHVRPAALRVLAP